MASPLVLEGLFVPLVTPFNDHGGTDFDALQRLAAEVLAAGASGVVALGTTGEPATLTHVERTAVVAACAEVCRDRALLLVGAGSNDTVGSIRSHEQLTAF